MKNELINTGTSQSFSDKLEEDAFRPLSAKWGTAGKIWVFLLFGFCIVGLAAYYLQLRDGLIVTGMRDQVFWGIYIVSFVFFVAVSLVGALVTAVLKFLNVEWRHPITRIAEIITLVALIFAGLAIIADMGRPDRLYHVLLHGRIQSPIVWDILVITTYMTAVTLLLYIPLIPDLARCRDKLKDIAPWKKKLYRVLALGWVGSDVQKKILHKSESIMVVVVIPVAVAIHTVTAWLFAMTHRPGWESALMGPYFVAGAFLVGAACVIVAMWVFREAFNLQKYIQALHFDRMGKLMVLLALIYLYFNINEFLVPGYKMAKEEAKYLKDIFTGDFSMMFWAANIFGIILPIILLLFKKMRRPLPIFTLSLFVIAASWLKRFVIVIPTLHHPIVPVQMVPESWHTYSPTTPEILITTGLFSGALLLITLFAKLFPIIPVTELAEQNTKNMLKLLEGEPVKENLAKEEKLELHNT